jgi:hypothetical protein
MIFSELNSLIRDIEAPFILLGLCLVPLFLNKQKRRSDESDMLLWRIALGLILCGVVLSFGILIFQDRNLLEAACQKNPISFVLLFISGVAAMLVVVLGLAYWQLLPARSNKEDHDSAS